MPWALDRGGQFVQRAFVHARARLVFTGLQLRHRPARTAPGIGRLLGEIAIAAEQRFEAAAEALEFFGCHDVSFFIL